MDWIKLTEKISNLLEKDFELQNHSAVGGGCINQACRIDGIVRNNKDQAVSLFIKFNQQNRLLMFEAEAAGLLELKQAGTIRIPQVFGSGIIGQQSFLLLENLQLAGAQSASAKQLGQQLAKMHQYTSQQFGWSRNNTIGATEQINQHNNHWLDFWSEHRLGYQLELAKQNGATNTLYKKGQALMGELASFFQGYQPVASLLHGDLWAGNVGYLESGQPVIFDPAVYYGDREADIAMTELFGGFPADFYAAYNQQWPLDKGYSQRKSLYNLYHILNHFNLFGGGYAAQAENMMDQLLNYK